MIKPLIVANWKRYVATPAQAQELLEALDGYLGIQEEDQKCSPVLCPPMDLLATVAPLLQSSHLAHTVSLGAQDLELRNLEVLEQAGVRYVIIGHSERRWHAEHPESNEVVNQKLRAALEANLIPVVCIGERERNEHYQEFLKTQVRETFSGLSSEDVSRCFLAYEPVWAISSQANARPDTPESAVESIKVMSDALIRNWKLEIGNFPGMLYGGSVSAKNVKSFLDVPGIQGVLVGRASTDKTSFLELLAAATS